MIDLFKVFMSPTAPIEVGKVLMSGFIGQGKKVDEFERMLSNHFDNPYVNTVNSCTSGLELVVEMIKRTLAFEKDDEIITTPLTCTATNFAILSRGVKLRWADVDPRNYNIDLDDVARKISPKTKAVMVVHWGGYPVDLDKLKTIQEKCNNLYGFTPHIIEDCAHAWGAKYKNKLIGTHGNFSVFSFQAIKHFTTGDGGLIISPNALWHDDAKLLRWYGLDRTSNQDFRCAQNIKNFGFKFHMNDINATIGIENYPHISGLVEKNKENAKFYNNNLWDMPGVTLPENETNHESSYWIYTIMVRNRENFITKMKEKGIMVSQVHDRNDKHDCLKEFRAQLPGLELIAKEMIAIPCGWWVTEKDRAYIVDCIKEGW
jgi:dTDP-4-amino-4,6-dideoxygalactose transaminase